MGWNKMDGYIFPHTAHLPSWGTPIRGHPPPPFQQEILFPHDHTWAWILGLGLCNVVTITSLAPKNFWPTRSRSLGRPLSRGASESRFPHPSEVYPKQLTKNGWLLLLLKGFKSRKWPPGFIQEYTVACLLISHQARRWENLEVLGGHT